MTKVFLDTNVLLDLVTGRAGCNEAACILAYSSSEEYELHVSTLTMANLAYYIRKHIKERPLYEVLQSFSNRLCVDSTSTQNYDNALSLRHRDFEDALQYYCALENECPIIVTNNIKDYQLPDILVLNPSDFLDRYER